MEGPPVLPAGFFRFRVAASHPSPPGEGCRCAGGDRQRYAAFIEIIRKQISYPRALFPDSYCAQAGPSEGASRGVVKRDRLAVAAHGCNTHTQRAAAEAAWSRRHGWRHRVLWWQCRNSVPNGQALQQPTAVDRNLSHRGPCGGKPQTPRAGRWREGGLAVSTLRTPVSAEIAVPLRCGDASRPVGPSDPRRPARPRTFFRQRIGRMTRVHPHRENEGGWPEPEFKFRDTHALIPPRFSRRGKPRRIHYYATS
jgi:hypothetical protein